MTEKPQTVSCSNCRWSAAKLETYYAGKGETALRPTLYCHYNPPSMAALRGFPMVLPDDFCREFLAK